MTINEESLISLDELRSVLSADEGPSHARSRTRRPRRPFLPAAVAAALLVGAVVVLSVQLLDEDGDRDRGVAGSETTLRHVALPPLPPGPQRLEGASGTAAVEYVSLEEMIARANLVFVGTVAEIGGTEILSRDEEGFALEANRVRYRIDRVLRGDAVDQIDITNLALGEATFPAGVGERYLIFAEWRPLGSPDNRRLVPAGYAQGVYEVVGPDRATNVRKETVSIDAVAGQVAATDRG